MIRLKQYAKIRLATILTVTLLAILYYMTTGISPEPGTSLHAQLSKASGLYVEPGSIIWINYKPAANLYSATHYKTVVFLAKTSPKQKRDLYTAKIKLAPKETIVDIDDVVNLTNTAAGDEFLYKLQQSTIAVATKSMGHVRSVSVFDLAGESLDKNHKWTTAQKWLARISDWQRTGSFKGIDKKSIRFNKPASSVDFSIVTGNSTKLLILEWLDSSNKKILTSIDLNNPDKEYEHLRLVQEIRLAKRPMLWLVDTVRTIPAIGPGPIEWAEGRVFALKDRLNRFKYAIAGDDENEDIAESAEDKKARNFKIKLNLSDKVEVGDYQQITWPPENIDPPVFSRRKRGEGEWIPANPDFIKHLKDAPPSVYKTFVRSDIRRPYVRVKLFAIDSRQLSLHMVGGHEDPISTTGEVGTGRIPRDPDILNRVTLAFNGAFKTIHGQYGMMADRSVLLPPKNDGATVAVDDNGVIAMGSWPADAPIPDSMVSFRQNMDPLIENGVVNPKRRYLWGFTLDEDITNMNTIRSGICMTDNGTMIYAWGDDLTGETLGIAMIAAGCNYGIHLDMNPFHTVLAAFRFKPYTEGTTPEFTFKKLIRDVRFWPKRFVSGAPKDFFYMTLRKNRPPGENWDASHITQPAPAFLPSVYKKHTDGIFMIAVDTKSTKIEIYPGITTTATPDADPVNTELISQILPGDHARSKGQIFKGKIISDFEPGHPVLSLTSNGKISIQPWDAKNDLPYDAIGGDWLIHKNAEYKGSGEIIALAVLNNKWLFAARGRWQDILDEFVRNKISDAVAFQAGENKNTILLRYGADMVSGTNSKISLIDPASPSINLYAIARTPFGTSLKNLFAK